MKQSESVRVQDIWLEREDLALLKEGEEVTLMDWGNAIVEHIHRSQDGKHITGQYVLQCIPPLCSFASSLQGNNKWQQPPGVRSTHVKLQEQKLSPQLECMFAHKCRSPHDDSVTALSCCVFA